jgi:hypothetical protein
VVPLGKFPIIKILLFPINHQKKPGVSFQLILPRFILCHSGLSPIREELERGFILDILLITLKPVPFPPFV